MGLDPTRIDAMVGKTLAGVVVKASDQTTPPLAQLYLEFTDGTYIEWYTDGMLRASGMSEGGREEVLAYMSPPLEVVHATPADPD